MTLRTGLFVAPKAGGDGSDGMFPQGARLALAGILPSAGVLTGGAVTGSTSGPNMKYTIAAGVFVTARGAVSSDGVYLSANDGPVTVDSTFPAPSSGNRWDLIWVRQKNAFDGGFGDANSLAEFGVTSGSAGSTPVKPYGTVPAGALVLAEASVGTGIANAGSAVLTAVAPTAFLANQGDTGWKTLTYTAGVTQVTQPPQYRVKDGIVYFQGDFKGSSAFPPNTGPYQVVAPGGLPTSARPAKGKNLAIVSTGGSPGLLQILTDGSINYVNGPAAAGNVAFGDGCSYPLG